MSLKLQTMASKGSTAVKNFVSNPANLARMAFLATFGVCMLHAPAYADEFSAVAKVLLGYVKSIVRWVGAVYFIIAAVSFFAGVRNEDAERQTKSIMNIFIAVALIIIPTILDALMGAAGGGVGIE